MKDLSQEKKIDILLAGLDERYEAMRAIRDRVQSIGVWALGLMLAAGGWLIQSETTLTLIQKIICIAAVVIAVSALRFKYLEDLNKGFKGQQRVTARLEKVLGFFTPGALDDGQDSIYPEQWEKAGTEKGDGKFFGTTYLLLVIGTLFLIVAIWFSSDASCPDFLKHWSRDYHFRSSDSPWRERGNIEQKENKMLQPQNPESVSHL